MDKHLFHYKGIKGVFFIIGLLTVLQAGFIVLQAVMLATAITNMFKGASVNDVLLLLSGFGVASLLRQASQLIKERVSYRFAEKTAYDMQRKLLAKLFMLGPREIGKTGSGNMVTLCLEGVQHFRTYLELFIPRVIATMVIPAIVLTYIFYLESVSGVILVLTMPIMLAFLILLGLVARKKMDDQWSTYQLLSRHFVDSLRGLETLKYLGKSRQHRHAIALVSDKYRIATNRTLRVAFLSTFSLDFFSSLSVAVVAVGLGLRLIDGNMDLQTALTILILAPEYFLPVREVGNDYHATMDGKEAGDTIHQILAKQAVASGSTGAAIPKWNACTSLKVEKLARQYEDRQTACLHDVTFQVNGYQKIGIVGASGAGKSTLIDLLSGFSLLQTASISIGGVSVTDFAMPGWQQQITYIPQHPYIFAGTIADNIRIYAPDASQQDIEQALQVTGLAKWVHSLPHGIEERIGNGGRVLSGGEEQRIALARAFLQNRPIMLFDEPTAHLDIETEHDIKLMMLPLFKNKLVFFATHRLHWMKQMDLILVMENGTIKEFGTHHDLYEKRGAYYALIRAQTGDTA
jgi:ATP-binding cassette subfamily C protein CydD